MIRAAADGDAKALKEFLDEGADLNGTNPGGQTALILAALRGRFEIVRLLLQAGADIRLRDNHGLTAVDWSQRKGFSEITQLLIGFSTPHAAMTIDEATAKQTHLENPTALQESPRETERGNKSIADTGNLSDVRQKSREGLGPAAIAMIKTREKQADLDKERAAEENLWAQPLEERVSSGPDLWWTEDLHDGSPQEVHKTTEPETSKARMKTEQIVEPPGLRVEKREVLRKAEQETRRLVEKDQFPAPKTSIAPANIKRCPKCNTIYQNDPRTYCAYDVGRLVSIDESSARGVTTFGRPAVWVLVAITLFASVIVTYFITNRLAKQERIEPAPAIAPAEPVAKVEENNNPVVGGALVGKETHLPNPEYPEAAKNRGKPGTVMVVVRVNKKGRVISARALNGDWQLRSAAVKAARKATFSPEKLTSEGKVVAGTISYKFEP